MSGNMFEGIGILAAIGAIALIALVCAMPFALWWAFNHLQVVIR